MSNNIYGSIDINNKIYSFALEGHILRIVQNSSFLIDDFSMLDRIDAIYGITSDNRDILFINCTFHKNQFNCCDTITIEGYAISTTNGMSYDFSVNKISFYSDAINMFYPPRIAERLIERNSNSGCINLSTCDFKDTELAFMYQDIKCYFNINQQVNLKPETTNIIEFNSYFAFEFPQAIQAKNMIEYTQYIYDFLRLINYSSNILFSKIVLYKKENNGHYDERAILHIFQDAKEYENNMWNSVQIYDFDKKKISEIFNSAVTLRKYDKKLYLYFPKDKSERYTTDPIRWLSKALIFEGLFSDTCQKFKSKSNPDFKRIKDSVLDYINHISYSTSNEQKYIKKFYRHNDLYEGILSEKFNFIYKSNKGFLDKIIMSIEKEHGEIPNNISDVYMKYRNDMAHGNVRPVEHKELIAYRIMEPLIYLMLLQKTGLSTNDKYKIINKLF